MEIMKLFAVRCCFIICLLGWSGCHSNQKHPSKEPHPKQVSDGMPNQVSVVYNCSVSYIHYINQLVSHSGSNLTSSDDIAGNIMTFIDVLCSKTMDYGPDFLTCLSMYLPNSPLHVDLILSAAFKLPALSEVLTYGCQLKPVLNDSMSCIIESLRSDPSSLSCAIDIERYFTSVIASEPTVLDKHYVLDFCRIWGSMVQCISPYLAVCNPHLSTVWTHYGQIILTESCQSAAFEKSETLLQLEDAHSAMSEMFLGNTSIISTCSDQNIQGILYLLPVSVFSHSLDPSLFVASLLEVCEEDVESFMFCMEEMRLNISSEADRFIFQIIDVNNMRNVYKKLCKKMEVIKGNINCLLSTAMELSTCQCHVTKMMKLLEDSHHNRSYSNIVEPFCGLYTGYVRCYIGLLTHCSWELGMLLKDTLLGPLSLTCKGSRTAPCSPMKPIHSKTSRVLQCGQPVVDFVSSSFSDDNTTVDSLGLQNMMEHTEGLIIAAYEYTCSQGGDMKPCMQDAFSMSEHPLDVLLVKMFDMRQFHMILQEGCQPALIADVKRKLRFILSLMLSDARMSVCVTEMDKFNHVPLDHVDIHLPSTLKKYCRIWGDFSRCVETKLACTGSTLAEKWQHLTTSILTQPCYDDAVSVSRKDNTGVCDMHHVLDSAAVVCSMTYMSQFVNRWEKWQEQSSKSLAIMVRGELHHVCKSNQKMARQMVACLKTMVPSSFMILDRLIQNVFDLSYLDTLADSLCAQTKVLSERIHCIVDRIEAEDAARKCLHQGLKESLTISDIIEFNITRETTTACRGWHQFIYCLKPFIESCDRSLGWLWKHLGLSVLKQSCLRDLDLPKSHAASFSAGFFHTFWPEILNLAIIMSFYSHVLC